VRLIDQERSICALAHLLRRRYVCGEHVEVYIDEKIGWIGAHAVAELEQEEEEADVCNIPNAGHVTLSMMTDVSGRCNDDNNDTRTANKNFPYVQVQFENGSTRIFPHYLIRRRAPVVF